MVSLTVVKVVKCGCDNLFVLEDDESNCTVSNRVGASAIQGRVDSYDSVITFRVSGREVLILICVDCISSEVLDVSRVSGKFLSNNRFSSNVIELSVITIEVLNVSGRSRNLLSHNRLSGDVVDVCSSSSEFIGNNRVSGNCRHVLNHLLYLVNEVIECVGDNLVLYRKCACGVKVVLNFILPDVF